MAKFRRSFRRGRRRFRRRGGVMRRIVRKFRRGMRRRTIRRFGAKYNNKWGRLMTKYTYFTHTESEGYNGDVYTNLNVLGLYGQPPPWTVALSDVLTNVPYALNHQAMYQMYRINAFKITIIPRFTGGIIGHLNGTSSSDDTSVVPTLFYYKDYNYLEDEPDTNTLTLDINKWLNRPGVRQRRFTSGRPIQIYMKKPATRRAIEAEGTLTTDGLGTLHSPWIQSTFTGIPHGSVKLCIYPKTKPSDQSGPICDIKVTQYIEWKGYRWISPTA